MIIGFLTDLYHKILKNMRNMSRQCGESDVTVQCKNPRRNENGHFPFVTIFVPCTLAERHEMELSKEKESNITADEKDKKQITPLDVKVVVASKSKKVFTGNFFFLEKIKARCKLCQIYYE